MKLLFHVLLLLTTVFLAVNAQNVQLHYDFGKFIYDEKLSERPLLTSTVEMFKPDRWGSTFFFIDMDYKRSGVASAYWEIAREITFTSTSPFSAHIEYNGGLNFVANAYLVGGTFTSNLKDFSAGYSLSAMYKYIQRQEFNEPHNFQLTVTWYQHSQSRLLTLSGFADFWREKTNVGSYIFLAEPQFWLHLNKIKGIANDFNLSIGSELEISCNFAVRKGWYFIPTAAVKWDF
jgi:hypothetical protein